MSHIGGEGEPSPEHPDDFNRPSEEAGDFGAPEDAPTTPASDQDAAGPEDASNADKVRAYLNWLRKRPHSDSGPSPAVPAPRSAGDDDISYRDPEVELTTLGFGALDAIDTDAETTEGPVLPADNNNPDNTNAATMEDVFRLIEQADGLGYGEGAEHLIENAPHAHPSEPSANVPVQRTGNAVEGFTDRPAKPRSDESIEDTIELPTFTAPHDEIWRTRHQGVQIYNFGSSVYKVYIHRNTTEDDRPVFVLTPDGITLRTGVNDIVQAFFPDEDGQFDLDKSAVFQGAEKLPDGFLAIHGRSTPAEVSTNQARAEAADSTREYPSKIHPHNFTVIYPGTGEKMHIVTPDGTLIEAAEDARIQEIAYPGFGNPLVMLHTTVKAAAESDEYFSL